MVELGVQDVSMRPGLRLLSRQLLASTGLFRASGCALQPKMQLCNILGPGVDKLDTGYVTAMLRQMASLRGCDSHLGWELPGELIFRSS